MKKRNLHILVQCAVMVALASALSMVPIYEAPLGGSVTLFSMVPIILISYIYGIRWGLATSFVYSVIQLLLGLKNLSYIPTPMGVFASIVLDYIVAFTLIGLASVFSNEKKNVTFNVVISSLLVCILRFISHVLSGTIVWYEITKAGNWNEYVHKVGKWTYSIVYNLQYMGPETAITLIAAPVIVKLFFTLKRTKSI